MLLVDVASWQGGLRPADVKRAGFDGVNLKVSHGLSRLRVHPDIAGWIDQARSLGLGISTFHYLTADATGEAQATYAYDMLHGLGLLAGTAHQLDVECEPVPTLSSVRGYLNLMGQLLRRPIALYTGDWWWTARAGWDVADLTPYLWAAPGSGYLTGYPGDTSPHWRAGYGGWANLAVMQYAVAPLSFPDGTRGTIDVSKSAIRDPAVWTALTGTGDTGMTFAPDSCLAVRKAIQERTGLSNAALGIVGDDNHAQTASSYHLGKSANKSSSYTIAESSRDRNGLSEAASANDIGYWSIKGADGRTHTLRTFSTWLADQCRAGAADTRDIREVIYSPEGKTVKRYDALGIRTSGDDSHLTHTHISWFRDSENRDRAAVIRRYFAEEVDGDDMPMTPAERKELIREFWNYDPGDDKTGEPNGGIANPEWDGKTSTNSTLRPAWLLGRNYHIDKAGALNSAKLDQLLTALTKVLANVTADDGEAAQLVAEIRQAQAQTVTDVLAGLGGSGKSDAEIAAALRAALGPRAAGVAAQIQAAAGR